MDKVGAHIIASGPENIENTDNLAKVEVDILVSRNGNIENTDDLAKVRVYIIAAGLETFRTLTIWLKL